MRYMVGCVGRRKQDIGESLGAPKKMNRNPILEEIYAAREKLLADHKGNTSDYVKAARERALASGHPIFNPKDQSNGDTMAESAPESAETKASTQSK